MGLAAFNKMRREQEKAKTNSIDDDNPEKHEDERDEEKTNKDKKKENKK